MQGCDKGGLVELTVPKALAKVWLASKEPVTCRIEEEDGGVVVLTTNVAGKDQRVALTVCAKCTSDEFVVEGAVVKPELRLIVKGCITDWFSVPGGGGSGGGRASVPRTPVSGSRVGVVSLEELLCAEHEEEQEIAAVIRSGSKKRVKSAVELGKKHQEGLSMVDSAASCLEVFQRGISMSVTTFITKTGHQPAEARRVLGYMVDNGMIRIKRSSNKLVYALS